MSPASIDFLLPALSAALRASGSAWADAPMQALPDKGLAHDHVRLVGTGWLARIPKQSQMGLSAADNLAYQSACFTRASVTAHAPRLHTVLPPSPHLPRGALLVQEIIGQNARLPQDLGAIVQALAALHRLPLPVPAERPPLHDALDPLQALADEVAGQASYLHAAALPAPALQMVGRELHRLQQCCAAAERPRRHLIAFDGHPGNYVVQSAGSAVLVDLEKCRYSYPGLDLAHATLYTSTTWDADCSAVLTLNEVQAAYAVWRSSVGESAADAAAPWQIPLRRAMWLWSITWCAKWRAVSSAAARTSADGEDWSAQHSDAALVAHVRERVDHYLDASTIDRVLAECDALAQMPL